MGGGDAGLHFGDQEIEHFGRQPSGAAHALETRRIVDGDGEAGAPGGFERLGGRQFGAHWRPFKQGAIAPAQVRASIC